MNHHLYLSSTPLHSFFSIGLMNGPMSGAAQTLALIDRPPEVRDYIAEALAARRSTGIAVCRFDALLPGASAVRVLGEVSALSRNLQPSLIAVGNDRRIEFYAAVRGCPTARRCYIDDGLYSYLPHQDAKPAWREALSNWRRGRKLGLPLERPSLVGGSQAVQEAFVLLPPHVHAGLIDKPVSALSPEWFADTATREVCAAAAQLAGLDAVRCAGLRLLVMLPHPRFLSGDSSLVQRIQALVDQHVGRGELVALKRHPGADRIPLRAQVPGLSPDVLDLPATLPVEVLAPLLSGTLVVGTLTTGLLTLRLLGSGLRVFSLPLPPSPAADRSFNERAQDIYRSVGIEPLSAEPAPAP